MVVVANHLTAVVSIKGGTAEGIEGREESLQKL